MKKLQFNLWFPAHANQFDMDKKHKPDDGYNPEATSGPTGYDEAIGIFYTTAFPRRLLPPTWEYRGKC